MNGNNNGDSCNLHTRVFFNWRYEGHQWGGGILNLCGKKKWKRLKFFPNGSIS